MTYYCSPFEYLQSFQTNIFEETKDEVIPSLQKICLTYCVRIKVLFIWEHVSPFLFFTHRRVVYPFLWHLYSSFERSYPYNGSNVNGFFVFYSVSGECFSQNQPGATLGVISGKPLETRKIKIRPHKRVTRSPKFQKLKKNILALLLLVR